MEARSLLKEVAHMSLYALESALDEVADGFVRFADGCLYTTCESPVLEDMIYPLVITQEQHGYAGVYWLLPPVEKSVRELQQFLKYIGDKQSSPVLEFREENSCFVLMTYLQPESYGQDLQEFVLECDRYAPLLFAVSMCGEWSRRFVDMALLAPHSMYQA